MKKTALFILLIFSLVQVLPALSSVVCENNSLVFNVDEEKSEDKQDKDEKKAKKDFLVVTPQNRHNTAKFNNASHSSEAIASSPCLEKLTPPPNC